MTEHDLNSISFWNEAYRPGDPGSFWTEVPVPYVEQLAERFPAAEYPSVLDVPSGDGRNLRPWLDKRQLVVGLDSSEVALANASVALKRIGVRNCLLSRGSIFELPFHDSQFDIVFCWDLLGHLQDSVAAIHELLRVCKSGGWVIGSLFSTEDSVRQMQMTMISEKESMYKNTFYFRFFELADVEALLQNVGVKASRIDLAKWEEGPHPGYREYIHEHQSWCFNIQKE